VNHHCNLLLLPCFLLKDPAPSTFYLSNVDIGVRAKAVPRGGGGMSAGSTARTSACPHSTANWDTVRPRAGRFH